MKKSCARWVSGALLCCCLLNLFLSGCGQKSVADGYFRVDISADPDTLDPQTAMGQTAQMILENCMEGLYRMDSQGSPEPALAQDCRVSDDGLIYTFTLRTDSVWYQPKQNSSESEQDLLPVTAADFVFAFQRLFDPATGSAAAQDFSCLENAQEVLSGQLPASSLGVSAPDDATLILRLSHPNENLLSLLSTTAAYPCNQQLFDSSGGRYGLEADTIWYNGPFYILKWDHDKNVVTRRNPSYYDADSILPAGVSFYCYESDTFVSRFLEGETDAVSFEGSSFQLFTDAGYEPVGFQDTTWVLLFYEGHPALQNRNIRLALCQTMDLSSLARALPEDYAVAGSLVPGCVEQDGQRYLDQYPQSLNLPFDLQAASASLKTGLTEAGLSRFPACTVLVPESGSHSLLMSLVQPVWQKQLLCFINIQKLSMDALQATLTDSFDMALVPFQTNYNSPGSVLQHFVSGAQGNVIGYSNSQYDALLGQATASSSKEEAQACYRQAEQLLISDGAVVPMYFSSTYYVMAKGVTGIRFSPFGGRMDFRYAGK